MSDLSLRRRRWYFPCADSLECLIFLALVSGRQELMVGRLISPCRCRGTMKFVHLQCLNSWRYASPNRRSVYQCDQCGYKYHFNRTQYAAIASSIYTRVGSISPSQFMSLKHPLPMTHFYISIPLSFPFHILYSFPISWICSSSII